MNFGIDIAAKWIAGAVVLSMLIGAVVLLTVSTQWRWTVMDLKHREQYHLNETLPQGAFKVLDETKPVLPAEKPTDDKGDCQ